MDALDKAVVKMKQLKSEGFDVELLSSQLILSQSKGLVLHARIIFFDDSSDTA